MSKKLLKLVLFIIGVLFFTGGACPSNDTTASNKVAQSEIYQSYSIRETGQSYEIKTFLRIGGPTGTTLLLSSPSKVTFNGQPMQEQKNTSAGTYYTLNVPNNTPNGTFTFTDGDGKTYTNKIDLTRVALNSNALKVNGAAPVAIPLSRPVSGTTKFDLDLNNQLVFVSESANETAEAYFDRAKNSMVILPAAWKKVSNGNVSVSMEVTNSIPTQQGTALGGNISFTYTAAPLTLALLKGKSNANTNSASANVNVNRTNTNAVAVAKTANTNIKSPVKNSANTNISSNKRGEK